MSTPESFASVSRLPAAARKVGRHLPLGMHGTRWLPQFILKIYQRKFMEKQKSWKIS